MAEVNLNIERTFLIKKIDKHLLRVYYDFDGEECYLRFDFPFINIQEFLDCLTEAQLSQEPILAKGLSVKVGNRIWEYDEFKKAWCEKL